MGSGWGRYGLKPGPVGGQNIISSSFEESQIQMKDFLGDRG